jgi:hypothetical protein
LEVAPISTKKNSIKPRPIALGQSLNSRISSAQFRGIPESGFKNSQNLKEECCHEKSLFAHLRLNFIKFSAKVVDYDL